MSRSLEFISAFNFEIIFENFVIKNQKSWFYSFLLLGRDPLTGKQTGEQTSKATDIFQCCTQAKSCPNVNNQPYYVDDYDVDYGNTGSRTDALDTTKRVTVIGLDSVSTHL